MLMGGLDEIVYVSVWYRMIMSRELCEVRDFNSTTQQIFTKCLLCDRHCASDWGGGNRAGAVLCELASLRVQTEWHQMACF